MTVTRDKQLDTLHAVETTNTLHRHELTGRRVDQTTGQPLTDQRPSDLTVSQPESVDGPVLSRRLTRGDN